MLRDLTERVWVATKGRFDRARTAKTLRLEGLPHDATLTAEDFMPLTLDVWEIAPESARRVGHPAPFPLELPEKLIALYTYADDLVLDPFMGSGTALVAAALYAFDGDFTGAVGGVVQGGWDTDTNGAAVGSVMGAIVGPGGIDERWTTPLKNRIASSLPGFDSSTVDGLARRAAAVATPAVHA